VSLNRPQEPTDDLGSAPLPDVEAEARNGAEALVQLLVAQGVRHIFLNPGTDTAPIQEAAVALGERGHGTPRLHLCPDERVALSAAQGYWARTGQPQAVIVHVDVGTLNMGAAVHNAQRTHSGVVIIAGKAPRTFDGELEGGRTIAVHWQQDQPDPAAIVRGLVKWTEEITLPELFASLVPRAFQVSRSAPAGPVYLLVAREVLMRRLNAVRIVPPARRRPPVTPPACHDAIVSAARWLAEADRPLIVTARIGRNPTAVAALAELVELTGTPVTDVREYLNLPSSHGCYVEDDSVSARLLREADLVVLIDVEVPWVPSDRRPPPGARVVQIDLDPVKASMVNWSYSIDLPIQADSAKALPQLVAAVRAFGNPQRLGSWADRRDQLADASRRRAEARAKHVASVRAASPIDPVALVAALNEVLDRDTIVLEEVTTNDLVVREHLVREEPGTIHAIGAAGLGWALGAAIGVKLAEPERDVVALVGDGSFVFGSPVASLWAAREAGSPFMAVILNNQGYRAAKLPVIGLFPEGASVRRNDFTGTVMSPPADYAAVARACGAHGERVTDPQRLVPALQRGLAAVRAGRCAVVDVILPAI
jgi:acetolactate synthase-1/2/3 large subunit